MKKFPPFVYFQPKLRGMRCIAIWDEGQEKFKLTTSTGLDIKFQDRITDRLEHFCGTFKEFRTTLDGELYLHGMSQEELNGVGKRTQTPSGEFLQYHIFDFWEDSYQAIRMEKLRRLKCLLEINAMHPDLEDIKTVETIYAEKHLWQHYANTFISKEGYEGLIIRNPWGMYVPRRSPNILKFKPTETDEYKIIGFEEGTGWATESLGAFIVEDGDGIRFNVGTGSLLTKVSRKHLWEHREELLGKTLVVKHELSTTNTGVPICTSAVDIKDTVKIL
jgi:ATP-dependent DNA ligase